MTLLSDLQYFSPYIFYFKLSDAKHCIFEQYEEYRKMTFRNRCTVLGGNGPVHLSIPLVGGRGQRTLMKHVRIMNKENWQARHWKTITSCYNKSPWFDHYRDSLENLYNVQFDLLVDWNLACFNWMTDKMAIATSVSLSEFFVEIEGKNEYEDWRNRLIPATINLVNPAPKRYPQVFEDRFGFIPNLSVLDYLFCVGNRKLKVKS